MRWLIPPILILLAMGCQHVPFCGSTDDRAYAKEYDLDRPHGRTPMGCKVIFPSWLAVEDRAKVVAGVHSYLTTISDNYPVGEFYWSRLIIFIHDNMDWMVAGYSLRYKVYGWRSGRCLYVAWMSESGAPRVNDPFGVLPHELFHALLQAKYGDSDPTHTKWFPKPEVQDVIKKARASAAPIVLSQESIKAAMAFKYIPWTEPDDYPPMEQIGRMLKAAEGGD